MRAAATAEAARAVAALVVAARAEESQVEGRRALVAQLEEVVTAMEATKEVITVREAVCAVVGRWAEATEAEESVARVEVPEAFAAAWKEVRCPHSSRCNRSRSWTGPRT